MSPAPSLQPHLEDSHRLRQTPSVNPRMPQRPNATFFLCQSESWIEVSSQQGSPSLSSAAGDIWTAGLRGQEHSSPHQRRGFPSERSHHARFGARNHINDTISQEEYDETESESDRVMTSSNEGVEMPMALGQDVQQSSSSSTDNEGNVADDDEGDESATALGITSNDDVFTPQPNAFSHPPSSQFASQNHAPGSYFPSNSTGRPVERPSSQRNSFPSQRPLRGTRRSSNPADHDAALRASLTTLLSCAAAARGLSKAKPSAGTRARTNVDRVDTRTLRMVPESVALGHASPDNAVESANTSAEPRSSTASSTSSSKKAKRRTSSKERQSSRKRLRTASVDQVISPTLLTWVVSAGVLVIASALSFSAGYKMGKESMMIESSSPSSAWAGADGGRHNRSGLGLRRRLWSGAAKAVTVVS